MFVYRPAPTFDRDDLRSMSPSGSYPPICFDDSHFLITQSDFERLPEYSSSKPTGVFDGKCWKSYDSVRRQWWIACYIEEDPPHPDGMLTLYRLPLIVEEQE